MKEGWVLMTLGKITKVQSGAGFPKKYQGCPDGDFPFAKVSDMNLPVNGRSIQEANNWVSDEVRHILRAKVFPKGSIVFPKIGAAIATNKKRLVAIPCCVDNNVIGLIPDVSKVMSEFLYYWFLQHDLTEFANDSELPSIRKTTVEEYHLLTPESLPEQKRIVAILDEVFAGIATAVANAEKNLANARELFESHLNAVFTQKGDGWVEKRLGDVCENLDNTRVPITKNKRVSGAIPYYGASGVVDYVADYIFDEDLLLVSEDGANLLARTYPIAFPIEGKAWVNNHAHVLRFEKMTYQKLIEHYLSSISLEPYVSGMAQPKLNQKALNSIPVPWPNNLDEVASMVAQITAIETQTQQLESIYQQKLDSLSELKQSILQKAFSGELTKAPDRALAEASA